MYIHSVTAAAAASRAIVAAVALAAAMATAATVAAAVAVAVAAARVNPKCVWCMALKEGVGVGGAHCAMVVQ